jgi:hypothetical protein
MLRSIVDRVLMLFGGRARFAPMSMAKQHAAAGRCGVVVVCHFPNVGHTTAVHPSWDRFSVEVVGHGSVQCSRASRGVPVFLPVPAGAVRVVCGNVAPRLGVDFRLEDANVGLVEVVPADAVSPRSGEMTLTIVNAKGDRSERQRGVHRQSGVA